MSAPVPDHARDLLDIVSRRLPEGGGAGVAVGMSGGVDSAAAAWLLAARGYRVVGVTFRFLPASAGEGSRRGRSDDEDLRAAAALCRRLGVRHVVEDLSGLFSREVIDRFVDAYRRGETPNPCILCNERVKFPALARAADRLELPFLATGHYARVLRAGGQAMLAAGLDTRKDQSYFLYRVPVRILERTLFPLGEAGKTAVTRAAAAIGVPPRTGGESQDACFLPDGDLRGFLSGRIDPRPGEVVDEAGRTIGRHEGTAFYTIGQRRGIGIAGAGPRYVAEIDPVAARVVLAPGEALAATCVRCRSPRLRRRRPVLPLAAKIRSRHPAAPLAGLEPTRGGFVARFAEPQRAPTPGQALVLYRDGVVLGGGIIAEATP